MWTDLINWIFEKVWLKICKYCTYRFYGIFNCISSFLWFLFWKYLCCHPTLTVHYNIVMSKFTRNIYNNSFNFNIKCFIFYLFYSKWCQSLKSTIYPLSATPFRVLSNLVRLPGMNQSLFALPSPPTAGLSSYFIWVRTAICFTSSSQQRVIPLLSNDGAGEGGKMHKIALCTFIYLRFWTVNFVYKA